MKKLLLVFLLLPVICSADEWYHNEIPLGLLGCDSFFETSCDDDFDKAIRHFWQYMAITEEEVLFVYVYDLTFYYNGYFSTEPIHYQDYSDLEKWDKSYKVVLDGIDDDAFELR